MFRGVMKLQFLGESPRLFWGKYRVERGWCIAAFLIGAMLKGRKQITQRGAEQCQNPCKREQLKMNGKNARCASWLEATTHLPIGNSTPRWWWKAGQE